LGRKAHNVIQHYIKFYTKKGEIVLDPFMGSGVTIIEALKSERQAIGIDLNPMSVSIVENSLSNVNLEDFKIVYDAIISKIEKQYDAIYKTKCPVCYKEVKLDCVVWHDEKLLTVRGNCKDHGKFVKNAEDADIECYLNAIQLYEKISKKQKAVIPKDEIPKYVKRSSKNTIDELFSTRALLVMSAIKFEINLIKENEIRELFNFVFTSSLANTSKMLPGDEKKATYKSGWVISKFWVPNIHAERNAIECFKLRFKAVYKGKKEIKNLHKGNYKIYNLNATKTSFR
jgi:hypothetical protein